MRRTPAEKAQPLTLERLKHLLHYDPETGAWTRQNCYQSRWNGAPAGHIGDKGYLIIKVDGKAYKAHRLAVFYMTGEWPPEMMDHGGMDRADNRWSEIRPATRSQNGANRRISRQNKTGLKGVHFCNRQKSFVAQIQKDKQRIFLGYFDCRAAAHFAYLVRADELHGEFARAA